MTESNPQGSLGFAVCDAHHHLWDLNQVHYPWLATRGIKRFFGDPAPIQRNYLAEDFSADFDGIDVAKSVHIQVGAADHQHLAETAWVQSQIDHHPVPSALVAFADLSAENCAEQLDQLSAFPALRGIRQIVGRSPEEDRTTGSAALLHNPAWRRGLVQLGERNLSFDLQLIPQQMEATFSLLRTVEQLPVALCHCGSPWYRDFDDPDGGWQLWRRGLKKLAQLPNLVCKISGLSMFDHHWTEQTMRPVVDTVIELFGPERVMFGSNFPVDKLHTGYRRLWQTYFSLTQCFSKDQRRRMFTDNCARFYRL